MDSHFDEGERAKIESLIRKRFGLNAEEARSLIEVAEQRVAESNQLFGFTRVINQRFDFDERVELMEMLWQVVYVDGTLHHYEANLMRRLAGLINVPDRDSGEARKRARARLGMKD